MTDHQAERIQLAEAMGWKRWKHPVEDRYAWTSPDDERAVHDWQLPDPFRDANDDFAVLQWMRETSPGGKFDNGYGTLDLTWVAALTRVMEGEDKDSFLDWGVYEIGDYARAALKVLNDG